MGHPQAKPTDQNEVQEKQQIIDDLEKSLEKLTEFLYIAPIALVRFDLDGKVVMANPGFTKIFNGFSDNGMVVNFFELIEPHLPEFVQTVKSFNGTGTVLDNKRYSLMPPMGPQEELVIDIFVHREHSGSFCAAINNVTAQHQLYNENMINHQRLSAIFKHIDDYGIFTLDSNGRVNQWNNSIRNFTHLVEEQVIGQHFSQLFGLSDVEANGLLSIAKRSGWVSFNNPKGYPEIESADTIISVINDEMGQVVGYSIIARHIFSNRH